MNVAGQVCRILSFLCIAPPGYGYETRRGERRRDERCALIRASGAVLRNLTLVVVIAKINRDNHCFNLQVNL